MAITPISGAPAVVAPAEPAATPLPGERFERGPCDSGLVPKLDATRLPGLIREASQRGYPGLASTLTLIGQPAVAAAIWKCMPKEIVLDADGVFHAGPSPLPVTHALESPDGSVHIHVSDPATLPPRPPNPIHRATIEAPTFPSGPVPEGADQLRSVYRVHLPDVPGRFGRSPTVREYLQSPRGFPVLQTIMDDAQRGLPEGWTSPIVRDDVPFYNDHQVSQANKYPTEAARAEIMLPQALTWLDQQGRVGTMLFAGSGFQQTAKNTLGPDRVMHLSNEDPDRTEDFWGYFSELGQGLKVEGDVTHMDFPDGAFDSTLVCGLPSYAAIPSCEEVARVTKPGGRILFTPQTTELQDGDQSLRTYQERFREVPVPGVFRGFHLFINEPPPA